MVPPPKSKGARRLRSGIVLNQRYRIDHFIAEGGMNSVYKATDLETGQPLALKCLHETFHHNEVVRARFVDEGRIQMLLKHPNILRVFALIEDPILAFVMEFAEGGSLEDHLVARGPLPEDEILQIVLPIMSGLGLAHSKGIIHRDLKPSNILMQKMPSGQARPKVMDFGVAKVSRGRSLTKTGTTVGTLHYMSPEQIVGSKRIDGRADIYSMGITLYKLCTGEVPFNATTEFALMLAQVEDAPRPPRQLRPQISPEFERVILRSLQKKPHQRYQSVKAFTQDLVSLLKGASDEPTLQEPISRELMQFALMANEVAEDKTSQIMRSDLDEYARALASIDADSEAEDDKTLIMDVDNEATVEIDASRLDLRADAAPGDVTTQQISLPTASDLTIDSSLRETSESSVEDLATTELDRPRLKGPPRSYGSQHVNSRELTQPKSIQALRAGFAASRSAQPAPSADSLEDKIQTLPRAGAPLVRAIPHGPRPSAPAPTPPTRAEHRRAMMTGTRPLPGEQILAKEAQDKRQKLMVGAIVAAIVCCGLIGMVLLAVYALG